MSSNQDDGGESGEQPEDQTTGEGGGQPEQGRPQGGQPRGGQPQGGQPQGGQPQGGQGQPPGGQPPQGQPPAGQQPVPRGPSASQKIQAAFGDYAVKNQIKAILGTYAVLGLGVGLIVILMGSLGGGAGRLMNPGSVPGMVTITGLIVATILALSLSTTLPVGTMEGAVVSAVVNFAGFLVLGLLGIFLAETQTGAFNTIQPGQLLVPLFLAGIVVAIVAGLVTALGRKVSYPATREEAEAQEPPAPAAPPQQPQQPQQQP